MSENGLDIVVRLTPQSRDIMEAIKLQIDFLLSQRPIALESIQEAIKCVVPRTHRVGVSMRIGRVKNVNLIFE